MSDITKERWEFDEETGLVIHASGDLAGDVVLHKLARERSRAVLPEALALLERYARSWSPGESEPPRSEVWDVLERAGVLK